MALSDRIALLRNGSLEQVAAPREIYAHPATAYTAQFIGQTNLLRATVKNGMRNLRLAEVAHIRAATARALFSLRPEAIQIASDVLPVSARYIRFRGDDSATDLRRRERTARNRMRRGPAVARAHPGSRLRWIRDQEFSFLADDVVQVKG